MMSDRTVPPFRSPKITIRHNTGVDRMPVAIVDGIKTPIPKQLADAILAQSLEIERLQRAGRRTAHDLEKCIACDKNIDTCCGNWFYGDLEDGLKVHKRCENRWSKICASINSEARRA